MTNLLAQLNTSISDLHVELSEAFASIERIVANTKGKDAILSAALFSSANYNIRSGSDNLRLYTMKQTALAKAWSVILEKARAIDDNIASDMFYFASGTYYSYDIKSAVWALTSVKDTYSANVESYCEAVTNNNGLLPFTPDNVKLVLDLYRGDEVIDGHHVWSFLNKCGASAKTDVTKFSTKMTFRGTADAYGSEWVAGLSNIIRIARKAAGVPFSFNECRTVFRNTRANGFDDMHDFADVFTMSVAGNGNATLKFTPNAVATLNAVVPVSYKETYDHVVERLAAFY